MKAQERKQDRRIFPEMTETALDRCRKLAIAIDAAARSTDAYDLERNWTNAAGAAVYGDGSPIRPEWITAEFLADLPRQAFFFTGWNPPPDAPPLSPFGQALWRLLRIPSPRLGFQALLWLAARMPGPGLRAACQDGPPAEVRRALFEAYAARLPSEYVCGAEFDGTDLDLVAVQERLHILHRGRLLEPLRRKPDPVILEIGAGYGALARAIRRVVPQVTYIIVDLPHSLYLSGCYLATREQVPVCVRAAPAGRADEGSIVLVPNTMLSCIDGVPVDLAINTLSFGEMPERVVMEYASFISRNLSGEGCLFEQNFDNSHLGRANFCDPQRALRQAFRHRRDVRGVYLKGRPRIWTR